MPRPNRGRLSRRESRLPASNRGSKRGGSSRTSSSGSNTLLNSMPSRPESPGVLQLVRENAGKQWVSSVRPSADCSTSKFPGCRVLLMPGPGQKLDRMLSLIHNEDAQFQHHPSWIQLNFPARKGLRAMNQLKSRRLRSLLALAHHLDEQDRFLEVPGQPDSLLLPSKPSIDPLILSPTNPKHLAGTLGH